MEHQDRGGPWYSLPDQGSEGSVLLPLAAALQARIRPTGSAEQVLRAWSRGEDVGPSVRYEEPADRPPVRVRAAAVLIRDGRMLAIRYPPEGGRRYFIPGGGVEAGETPETAVLRELREETGLSGTVLRELAKVYNRGREEHYYLVAADGEPETGLDLAAGETLEWLPVASLPQTPVWPVRLAWRIAHWHTNGWPDHPALLSDSLDAQGEPCTW
ncbi:NUDIX domain-containing protein [Kitasatospora sp. NPDC002227]|uniref:NUDIX domain-containing protein n=1 Tax=Kitasatospora sp. NPDC002227 TaxID=3154773 RepID=UPI0033270781